MHRRHVITAAPIAAATYIAGGAMPAGARRIAAHVTRRGPLLPEHVQPSSPFTPPYYLVASVVKLTRYDLEAAVWLLAIEADPAGGHLRSAVRAVTRQQATAKARNVLIEHGIQGLLGPLPPDPLDQLVQRHTARLFPELVP